jgi:branched-chain amino acid transport system substrate-binding protein
MNRRVFLRRAVALTPASPLLGCKAGKKPTAEYEAWRPVPAPPQRGRSRRRVRSWSLAALLCLASLPNTSAAQSADQNPAPRRPRLRDTTLGYNGPSDDLTNLTEIRIGWFGPSNLDDPLTGDLWWAANFALQEANTLPSDSRLPASDFLRLPFRLIPRWSVNPWGTGVSQLARMVYDEQPLALLGSMDSATTHLAEQVVAKAQLPLVSPIATDKSVTFAGVSWMFSCAPGDDAVARVLVEAVQAELKSPAGKTVLLATTDHESRMTAREVMSQLSRCGRRPDFRFDVPPDAADIAQQLQAAADARPAVVLIIAGVEDSARLTRAVREKVGTATIFGGQSMGRRRFTELAGAAAEGVRFPLLFVPNPADANCTRFIERFKSEHQRAPDYTAALTYDAMRLLLEAIRRAGPNRARIREALAQLSPWPGIAGTIHFDGTGQNTRTDLCLGTIRNGAVLPMTAPSNRSNTPKL